MMESPTIRTEGMIRGGMGGGPPLESEGGESGTTVEGTAAEGGLPAKSGGGEAGDGHRMATNKLCSNLGQFTY